MFAEFRGGGAGSAPSKYAPGAGGEYLTRYWYDVKHHHHHRRHHQPQQQQQ